MEEAQRLLTVSVWKLYRCRLRRGGLRLHRSLQLSGLVRAARHLYLSARAAAGTLPGAAACGATPEPGETPREPSGDPRTARCPSQPSTERPSPRSERECATPPRERTGDHPEPPAGAPRAERHRERPPSPPSGDPANRDPPSAAPAAPRPAGAPRAGQKRRSGGSAGPGRGPVPSKRARLEAEAPPLPPGPPGRCSGPPAAAFGFLVRAVGAC